MAQIVRVAPFHYLHVLDKNSNTARVELGPTNVALSNNEKVAKGPEPMILIPPECYCIIKNPVVSDGGKPMRLSFYDGSREIYLYKVKFGDHEVRTPKTHPAPFPLYPYEELEGAVYENKKVKAMEAFKLEAKVDFQDVDQEGKSVKRVAGEQWLIYGPAVYIPQVEVDIVGTITSTIITNNTALKLQATKDCVDIEGVPRKAGQKWLIRRLGAYIPQVNEKIKRQVKAQVITYNEALHLQARTTYSDVYGITRHAGDEWLVTSDMSETHIPDIYERVIDKVPSISLSNRQYCYILDPYDPSTGLTHFGKKVLKAGECTFFLQPKEALEDDTIYDIFVLAQDEALLLQAEKTYTEPLTKSSYQPGDRWMIYGPCEYIPPVEVNVIETRKMIQIAENDGIYIRDTKSGQVQLVMGKAYMLKPHEEKFEMELGAEVEWLLGFRIKQDVLVKEITALTGAAPEEIEDLQQQIEMLKLNFPKEDTLLSQQQSLNRMTYKDFKSEAFWSRKKPSPKKDKKEIEMKKKKQALSKAKEIEKEQLRMESASYSDDSDDDAEEVEQKVQVQKRQQQRRNIKHGIIKNVQPPPCAAAPRAAPPLPGAPMVPGLAKDDSSEKARVNIAADMRLMKGLQNRHRANFQLKEQGLSQVQNMMMGGDANVDQDDGDLQLQSGPSYIRSDLPPPPPQAPGMSSLPQAPGMPQTGPKKKAPAKKGAKYVEEKFMQQASQQLPFGTFSQAPIDVFPQQQQQQQSQLFQATQRQPEVMAHPPAAHKEFQKQRTLPKSSHTAPQLTLFYGKRPWDDTISLRERSKVVNFKAPHNSAVQVYNFKIKDFRIEFGPALVTLDPDEMFTIQRLSGGNPKKEFAIALLYLPLGPDFMSDTVEVETSDHARLKLSVTYNWKFDVSDKTQAHKIFAVKDFVGYSCRAIASRIRGVGSRHSFDDFHKNSSELIKNAVFGKDESGNIKTEFRFDKTNLIIFGIDIQSVEPVDEKTRNGLLQSVSMAIEITTSILQMDAEHVAEKADQEWKGLLQRQKIEDEVEAEKSRKTLLELKAQSAGVQSTGKAIAEARARAETMRIQGEAQVKKSDLESKAKQMLEHAKLQMEKEMGMQKLEHEKRLAEIAIKQEKKRAQIEISKFQKQIQAIGKESIVSMAKAGPEFQARLLKGLGLKGFMVMDGKHPINLFNTAQSMLGAAEPRS